jgi:hypothetical protein
MATNMANNHSIQDFINGFGGGTRTNRFLVTGQMGKANLTGALGSFFIRSATMPGAVVGGIKVNYRGRSVVYPGDRIYKPWEITVLDENPKESKQAITLFKAFHDWNNEINNHATNTSTKTNPSEHFSNRMSGGSFWTVQQLDTNGVSAIRTFKLHNCWPAGIGPIELDMDKDNTLGTFSVAIVYSHFEIIHDK